MKKIKIIYFSLLIIISFFVSKIFFSYAFLTNKIEEHGKLNLIVGTLDYKLDSNDLHDNSITISSGDTKIITLSIKSLNDISSKYELYYVLENETDLVTVGFLDDSLNTKSGILEKLESKDVEVIIRNKSVSSQKIIFGVEGGLINNDLVLNDNKSSLVDYCSKEDIYTFDYTGGEQEFITPCSGEYQLETWGAQGGSNIDNMVGGMGAYSSANIGLKSNLSLYINIGGSNGYNGGGVTSSLVHYSNVGGNGGGATDIRIISKNSDNFTSLKSRIMVAAGGGGIGGPTNSLDSTYYQYPASAGVGHAGNAASGRINTSSGGLGGWIYSGFGSGSSGDITSLLNWGYVTNSSDMIGEYGTNGTFGEGGSGGGSAFFYHNIVPEYQNTYSGGSGGGGGGGYFGGGGGAGGCGWWSWPGGSGGGGSSYISGHVGTNAIDSDSTSSNVFFRKDSSGIRCDSPDSSGYNTLGYNTDIECSKHYSGYVFYNSIIIDGAGYQWTTEKGDNVVGMPTHDGTSTMIGNSGNGYAKITYLGK